MQQLIDLLNGQDVFDALELLYPPFPQQQQQQGQQQQHGHFGQQLQQPVDDALQQVPQLMEPWLLHHQQQELLQAHPEMQQDPDDAVAAVEDDGGGDSFSWGSADVTDGFHTDGFQTTDSCSESSSDGSGRAWEASSTSKRAVFGRLEPGVVSMAVNGPVIATVNTLGELMSVGCPGFR
jgi:hypothetical protein